MGGNGWVLLIERWVNVVGAACGVNGALYTLIACVTGCPCCYSCFYRAKMRQQYGLKESPCGDCLVHCFCEYCALCQEYRELKNRGYDLPIGKKTGYFLVGFMNCHLNFSGFLLVWWLFVSGWHGNVEKKNQNLEMASVPPAVEGGMTR